MKRVAAFLTAILMSASVFGCAKGPSDDEAAAIVADLVEKSLELNVIYFGEGMPAEADGDENYVGYYSRVTDDAPYKTEDELREATLNVFTEKYASVLFTTYLTGLSDPDSGVVYARYVENEDRLMKKTDYEPLVTSIRTYDLENITITRSTPDEIKATLTSFVNGVKDEENIVEVTVRLEERKNEKTGEKLGSFWRLDSPTY